jgi:hypothetical protein
MIKKFMKKIKENIEYSGLNPMDYRKPKVDKDFVKSREDKNLGASSYSKLSDDEKLEYDKDFVKRTVGTLMKYKGYVITQESTMDGDYFLLGKILKTNKGMSRRKYDIKYEDEKYNDLEEVIGEIERRIGSGEEINEGRKVIMISESQLRGVLSKLIK